MKEHNYKTAELLLKNPWWAAEYDELMHPELTCDFPNAPGGMPQYMDSFDAEHYRKWMSDTVTNYECDLIELYGTADENSFWAVSEIKMDTFWAGKPGKFDSRRFSNLIFKDGKLIKMREMTNPLKWLNAIGADVPIFRMDLNDPRIDEYLAQAEAPAHNTNAELSGDPEAVKARIEANLNAFKMANYWEVMGSQTAFAPDYTSAVWFLPPEMAEEYPEELMPRVEGWSVLSCPIIDFDSRGVYHATDDPGVYFCEYMCTGKTDWIGNNAPNARYRNRYWYILRFDELGRITRCEEILNPINKFNSIGVSIPTFPYYF